MQYGGAHNRVGTWTETGSTIAGPIIAGPNPCNTVTMPAEKRKPRPQLKVRTQTVTSHNSEATSAPRPATSQTRTHTTQVPRWNLKLSEWLTIFAYIDAHPMLPQTEIVKHFATLKSGALFFTQLTLSRKLQERSDLEACAQDNPSALHLKCPRVVTRPDIERALFLWVKHMEAKGEEVNGPMLKEKCSRFEELFNVHQENLHFYFIMLFHAFSCFSVKAREK